MARQVRLLPRAFRGGVGSRVGIAEPIARYLLDVHLQVVGVDSSAAMIGLAEARFPESEWIVADMRQLALGRRFGGILAWDSFFHLRPDDQRAMFARFASHASAGAPLMFTSGTGHGEAIGSYCGDPLYHASLNREEYEPSCRERLQSSRLCCGRSRVRRAHGLAGAAPGQDLTTYPHPTAFTPGLSCYHAPFKQLGVRGPRYVRQALDASRLSGLLQDDARHPLLHGLNHRRGTGSTWAAPFQRTSHARPLHKQEADALLNDLAHHPHAFVLACVMDRQIKAERAWAIPYRLARFSAGFPSSDCSE